MYAVIEASGAQHKVAQGEKLILDRMSSEAGATVTFDRVLMVNDGASPKFGTPLVENATVDAEVLEHKKGDKIIAFKMRRRKGYRRKKGFRRDLTIVQIKAINA